MVTGGSAAGAGGSVPPAAPTREPVPKDRLRPQTGRWRHTQPRGQAARTRRASPGHRPHTTHRRGGGRSPLPRGGPRFSPGLRVGAACLPGFLPGTARTGRGGGGRAGPLLALPFWKGTSASWTLGGHAACRPASWVRPCAAGSPARLGPSAAARRHTCARARAQGRARLAGRAALLSGAGGQGRVRDRRVRRRIQTAGRGGAEGRGLRPQGSRGFLVLLLLLLLSFALALALDRNGDTS